MTDDKTQRVAYMKGFAAGHRKFEAEFETLLEAKRNLEIENDKIKTYNEKHKASLLKAYEKIAKLEADIEAMYEDAAGANI